MPRFARKNNFLPRNQKVCPRESKVCLTIFLPLASIFPCDRNNYFCTGQAQESRPEDITCLRSGAPCAEAFDKVSEIWDKIPEKIEQLPEEIDLDEDLFDDDISDED